MDVTFNYDVLTGLSRSSFKVAEEAESYAERLYNKTIKQLGDIEGNTTTYLQDADYFVNNKIKSLKEKANEFTNYGNALENLYDTAVRADKEVAAAIAGNRESFMENYGDELKINPLTSAIAAITSDLRDICFLFDAAMTIKEYTIDALSDVCSNIKYWYNCEGGKQVCDLVFAGLGTVVAIVTVIATLPASGPLAVMALIGAGMAVVDSAVDTIYQVRALSAANGDDPAWAYVYGNKDGVSDMLKFEESKNKYVNKASNFAAGAWTLTSFACSAASIVNDAKAFKDLNDLKDLKDLKDLRSKGGTVFKSVDDYKSNSAIINGFNDSTGFLNGFTNTISGQMGNIYLEKFGATQTNAFKDTIVTASYLKDGISGTYNASKFTYEMLSGDFEPKTFSDTVASTFSAVLNDNYSGGPGIMNDTFKLIYDICDEAQELVEGLN